MKKIIPLITVLIVWTFFFSECLAEYPKVQIGIASYYSNRFQNRLTANGERYLKNKLTAAHRFYPHGTVLRVTNLLNGKIVTVRVNDRGPFIKGRIIDLSARAAQKISMIRKGIVKVKTEVIRLGK
ncbi:septal ring lytic transglycosylase RlpA family protein [Desulfonema magnum]|uniref:Probable endolytic peptidoglycan transglycosylase RlpA n=1 Tax=Desulfonema magnum TaxID=45655 RepID=A0A975GN30_9BACT|nr:septal ring lytic transglycosylase RlpA family protein [Desulfonema magnum]QTA87581.1 Peptidoglycan transglycosylase domain-containing protein [Desulfonema magnum]